MISFCNSIPIFILKVLNIVLDDQNRNLKNAIRLLGVNDFHERIIMMNLSISKSFVLYSFGFACVRRKMMNLSMENIVCIVCKKFMDGTVGTVQS